MDINVLMRAPVIVIPENVFEPTRPCVIVDSGTIKIYSKTLLKVDKSINYKEVKDPKELYDIYEATLTDLSIQIVNNGLKNGIHSYIS